MDQVALGVMRGKIKGMMADHDLRRQPRDLLDSLADERHISFPKPAVLRRERAGAVQPEDRNLGVTVGGPQIVRDVLPILPEGLKEPSEHVVGRHVVVAGNHNLRVRQGLQERPRVLEFGTTR
jgi:hypothetical protein